MKTLITILLSLFFTLSVAAQPNVVFIMADDLGWGDLGCYGNTQIKTPNLDQFRLESVLATHYNSCGCVCSPARTALVVGRFPSNVGVHRAIDNNNSTINQVDYVDPNIFTIADLFKLNGYITAHYGKWHLGSKAPSQPNSIIHLSNYGFDFSKCEACANSNIRYSDTISNQDWLENADQYIIDDAITFLTNNYQNPFYLQVFLHSPHATIDPNLTMVTEANYKGNLTKVTTNGWTSTIHAYYVQVTYMDKQIGRLLNTIENLGIKNNTIVIFTSDNGPADIYANSTNHSGAGSPGPFRGGKHSLYEGGVRMPLLVRWPNTIPANSTTDHMLAGVDWLPTFAQILNTDLTSPHDGLSIFVPLILPNEPWLRNKPIFGEWRFGDDLGHRNNVSPGAFVQSPCGRWKLYRNRDGSRIELYNLVDDPMEMDNVAAENPIIVTNMVNQLLNWQRDLPACVGCENEGNNSYPWP